MRLSRLLFDLLVATSVACSDAAAKDPRPETAALAARGDIPADALNPAVRQESIRQTICVPGYAASVRPPTSYSHGVKLRLLREQAIAASAASDFELDHRIPLALGGHPSALKNLALQRWDGADGARNKDRVERRLHRLVCIGELPLEDAQQAIYFDWQSAARAIVVAH